MLLRTGRRRALACAGLCLIFLGLPWAAQADLPAPEPSYPLEHYGYTLTILEENKGAILRGPVGQSWSLPRDGFRMGVVTNGPADFTGNGVPDLIVLEYTSRSGGVVHILELGPEEITVVQEFSGHIFEIGAYLDLYPGQSLDDVYGPDAPGILDRPGLISEEPDLSD